MDKVLIVDNDLEHLKKVQEGFKDLHHFNLEIATAADTAIRRMEKTRISVLVTSLRLPGADGLDLLSLVTRKFPSIPCIVVLDKKDPKPWFPERTGHTGLLYYIKKPFSFGQLASAIFVGLNLRDEGLTRDGMILGNFLPLFSILKKTCRLEVRVGTQKRGFIYFSNGVLLDAQTEFLSGEGAAREMAAWRGIHVFITPLPPERRTRKIKDNLMKVIGATWDKEEEESKNAKEPAAARANNKDAAKSPQPASKPSRGKSKLETALNKYINLLASTKGYKGLAIMSPEGKVLASHSKDETIDFEKMASAATNIITHCSKAMLNCNNQKCTGITVHTQDGILIIKPPGESAHMNLRFICLLAADANAYFIQVQINTIIPKILAEI